MFARLRGYAKKPRPATIIAFAALVFAMGGGAIAARPGGTPVGVEQADSVKFALNFVPDPSGASPDDRIGWVVYCGVATKAEPYVVDVAVTNPARDSNQGTGWLNVALQDDESWHDPGRFEYSVPFNDSYSFGLTLGGVPDHDQMVRITSLPLGDENGGGVPFRGIASVRAQSGAGDPFDGDGRTDNFCVSIGLDGVAIEGEALPGAEFQEGEISTSLPVPDDWVTDGDGSDGGVLAGFPH